jgi:hypothetical protein
MDFETCSFLVVCALPGFHEFGYGSLDTIYNKSTRNGIGPKLGIRAIASPCRNGLIQLFSELFKKFAC